ncbi:MAG TPA: gluconate 2-dehydrogenase subunit 3 family protein [Blastocatellia bacterium]|nr:gluconate 2-dehydrogenase subunit 3 family protein [Blastocatellia bacterium]
MNRRDSLKGLGLLVGGNLLAPSLLASFLQTATAIKEGKEKWQPRLLSAEQAALLPELVEVIIPTTDTPGAKAALVHVFVDLYAADCYPKAQQELFLKGLDTLDDVSRKQAGRAFLKLSAAERLGLLKQLEKASWESNEAVEQSFVRMLKNLTLMGFFCSQPGATRAAEYQRSPGPFEGCTDLKPGQKADALPFI